MDDLPTTRTPITESCDRLCVQLGVMQGFVVGGLILAVAGALMELPLLSVLGAAHAVLGATLWWRRFGLALTVPVEMRTWSNDGTRPYAPHELRRIEKKFAWEYGHDVSYRYGPCWRDARPASARHLRRLVCGTCWKRRLDGTYTRRRAAMADRRDGAPLTARVPGQSVLTLPGNGQRGTSGPGDR